MHRKISFGFREKPVQKSGSEAAGLSPVSASTASTKASSSKAFDTAFNLFANPQNNPK